MNNTYNIEGADHEVHHNQLFMKDPNYYPEFPQHLEKFKTQIQNQVNNNEGKSYVHFGDGDYHFLKQEGIGSASPGKRALSVPYYKIDIQRFRNGWNKADYHCVEYFENMRPKLQELYPGQKTIPTEFLYGLTASRWFTKQFKGKIGLIGAGEKMDLIKELLKHKEYQDYLGLEEFNDYIKIPQKFACDNLDNTIQVIKEQLENANPETKIYLYGVGHVKSGLMHHLPSFKKALYIDVGAGIDGLAGLLDFRRPYAKAWVNYRLKDYDYSKIDLLGYNIQFDNNLVML